MKVSELIGKINQSPENRTNPDFDNLASELGLQYYGWTDEERITTYRLSAWNCTDTHVGMDAYFFDGDFFAISNQTSRKGSVEFTFFGKEIALNVRGYVRSLIDAEDGFDINDVLFDADKVAVPETYTLLYSNQFLSRVHLTAFYHGEEVQVISTESKTYPLRDAATVYNGTVSFEVPLETLRFPIIVSE